MPEAGFTGKEGLGRRFDFRGGVARRPQNRVEAPFAILETPKIAEGRQEDVCGCPKSEDRRNVV